MDLFHLQGYKSPLLGYQRKINPLILPIEIVDDGFGVSQVLAEKLSLISLEANVVTTPSSRCRALIDLSCLFQSGDGASGLFKRSKTLLHACGDQDGLYYVVEGHGFIPEFQAEFSTNADSVGAISLAKTVKKESPKLLVKGININHPSSRHHDIAQIIFQELLYGGDQIDVSYDHQGNRFQLDIAPYQQPFGQESWQPLKENDVLVVTGGARGVTASCIIELAKQVKLNIAILSRSQLSFDKPKYAQYEDKKQLMGVLFSEAKAEGLALDPKSIQEQVQKILREREVKQNLRQLEHSGSQVKYIAVDVAKSEDLGAALREIRSDWGDIHGIVHGAGVLADKFIVDKSIEDFEWVYKTKVDGFKNLLNLCQEDPISHICVFSSVSGRVGNLGQSDYAMANEMLNKMCQQAQIVRPQTVVKSLAWGPWDGGMVSSSLKRHFAEQGIQLIPIDEGAKLFVNQLQTKDKQVEIIIGSAMERKDADKAATISDSEFAIFVSEKTHSYLNSHRVKGKVVVPVVLMLEWIGRLWKGKRTSFRISDAKVKKGIIIDTFEDGAWIDIKVSPDAAGMLIVISYKGHPCFEAKLKDGVDNSKPSPVMAKDTWVRANLPYDDVLFHGPEDQVIKRLERISQDGCDGLLMSPESLDGQDASWVSDCAVIDGGLQLAVTWFKDETNLSSLPTDIESFEVYSQPKFGQDVSCYLKLRHRSSLKSQWDIDYVDQGGQRMAKIAGLSLHAVPSGY